MKMKPVTVLTFSFAILFAIAVLTQLLCLRSYAGTVHIISPITYNSTVRHSLSGAIVEKLSPSLAAFNMSRRAKGIYANYLLQRSNTERLPGTYYFKLRTHHS